MMRMVSVKQGAGKPRSKVSNTIKTLAFMLLSAVLGCSTLGSGGAALAGYSTAQAKMAGHYESFSRSPAVKKKNYKKSKRKTKRKYSKAKKKKYYKKNRSAKRRYGSKKKNRKTAAYRKSSKKKKYSKYKYKKKHKKVAALTPFYGSKTKKKSLSGGGVRWVASSGCLNGRLKSVVYQVAAKFGPVTVSSTCRSRKRNARVGGAKRSKHLTGNAVDFRVHANHRAAYAYLKSHGSVGGYKHYGGGLFHIDTGPRRTW